ncbi:MAG: MFS transporter [Clostridia bacterium]|nr:MFS transporter [Clostridia bacterium]
MNLPALRQQRILRLMCSLIYFTKYLTRSNYAAVILAICEDLSLSRAEAGLAVTGSFFTYAIGQLVCGILGDRISPKNMICIGLIGTAVCNIALPFFSSALLIALIWCINGFFQAMVWPPLVRILAENLNESDYMDACSEVYAASSIAIIVTYLTVPLFLQISDWRMAFFFPAALTILFTVLWMIVLPRLSLNTPTKRSAVPTPTASKAQPIFPLLMRSGTWMLLLPVLFHGLLRDGITTWLPSCVADLGGLDTSSSILSAVVLPIFSIICVRLAAVLFRRMRHETTECALLFGISTAAALVMFIWLDANALLLVTCMAIITGGMNGINLLLISRLPGHFAIHGCVAGMSGLLNCVTYVGSALSTYAIAAVSENFGWSPTVMIWAIAAAVSGLLCMAAHRTWLKFKKEG